MQSSTKLENLHECLRQLCKSQKEKTYSAGWSFVYVGSVQKSLSMPS
jgi:hypothetical protein